MGILSRCSVPFDIFQDLVSISFNIPHSWCPPPWHRHGSKVSPVDYIAPHETGTALAASVLRSALFYRCVATYLYHNVYVYIIIIYIL
jgi:hypothetical protein